MTSDLREELPLDHLSLGASSTSTPSHTSPSRPPSPASSAFDAISKSPARAISDCSRPAPAPEPPPPRLPPELIRHVVRSLQPEVVSNVPIAHSTLASLSLVCRQLRVWALEVRYDVVVLPRHVREFKRWYESQRRCVPTQWEFAGRCRALFCGLDDVSRLTTASQGWEADLLRTLHYAGPSLERLSLWHDESKVVLRDASQVRSGKTGYVIRPAVNPRGLAPVTPFAASPSSRAGQTAFAPLWSWGESLILKEEEEEAAAAAAAADQAGTSEEEGPAGSLDGQHLTNGQGTASDRGSAEQRRRARAEAAAARERERQKMPNWLRRELETQKPSEVARRHRAHVTLDSGSDQDHATQSADAEASSSSLPAAAAIKCETRRRDSSPPRNPPPKTRIWGCQPRALSLFITLPLYEHERPANFRQMTIFSRVEELDVYVPTGSHAPTVLSLLAHLDAERRLRRLRLTTPHATFAMAKAPFCAKEARRQRTAPTCTAESETSDEENSRKGCVYPGIASEKGDASDDSSDVGARQCVQNRDPTRRRRVRRRRRPVGANLGEVSVVVALRSILCSETLCSALADEFVGRHCSDAALVSRALHRAAVAPFLPRGARVGGGLAQELQRGASGMRFHGGGEHDAARRVSSDRGFDASLAGAREAQDVTAGRLGADDAGEAPSARLRVVLLQRNQATFGKLRERREDFEQLALGRGQGAWAKIGLWDE